MKTLLFGKNGQVGWELNRSLLPLGELIVLGRDVADFSKPESLRCLIRDISPDLIVNSVAYTAVDKAEGEEDLATVINATAPGVIAEESRKIGALLVHYSTDYVFDGTKKTPYTESDKPNPINVYGKTKLAGEELIKFSGCDYLILRTSWVYASRGNNFMLTMLRLAREREELNIVSDQVGSPTPARLIAEVTLICVRQAMQQRHRKEFVSKIYHLTTVGGTSWYDFAVEIIHIANEKLHVVTNVKKINPIQAIEYPTPATRPSNSRLDTENLERDFYVELPSWKDSLNLCALELLR